MQRLPLSLFFFNLLFVAVVKPGPKDFFIDMVRFTNIETVGNWDIDRDYCSFNGIICDSSGVRNM